MADYRCSYHRCLYEGSEAACRRGETELRTMDAGETLAFQMADGNVWTLDFEAGNLLRNNTCYETEGWKNVQNVIRDDLTEEGLR